MARNLALLLLASMLLVACGGGGGGGDSTPSARFTIDRQSVSFVGEVGAGTPSHQTVTGTVSNASGNIFVLVEYTNPHVVADVRVSVSGNRGIMSIYPANPNTLGEGDYSSQITVRVCSDAACNAQISGSPKTISVSYRVDPEPPPPDTDGDGVPDDTDAFPNDPNESADNDGDGIGDNADTDDDNDGVDDVDDDFPFNSDLSVAATQVNITITGDGAVASSGLANPCTADCSFQTDNFANALVDFTASAAPHFEFTSWGNASYCDDADTSCQVNTGHIASLDLNVVFTEDPHMTLLITADENGSVIEKLGQLECADNCEIKLYGPENQALELIGLPQPAFDFDGWTNAACGAGETCELSIVFGTSITLDATFSPNPGTFDLCPGDPAAVFSGTGEDDLGSTFRIVPLCNGHVILANRTDNTILVRDVVTGVTTHTFQLTATPADIVLVEELKLVYVTHGSTTHISRIDLRTGLVTPLFVEFGAQSVAASDEGTLFVRNNVYDLHLYNSETGLRKGTTSSTEINIDYNDATARLIGNAQNFFWNPVTMELSLQGPSQGGGSGSDCNYVVVSPDGEHAAYPCGGGNGSGYTVYDFYSHDPSVVFGEWVTGAYPSGAAFAPSNKYVLLTNRFDLQLFDVETHQLIQSQPTPGCSYSDTRRLAVSTDGKLLFGVTWCGFNDETAIVTWIAYDTN